MSTNDRLAPDAYERLLQALEPIRRRASLRDTYLTNIPHQAYGRHHPESRLRRRVQCRPIVTRISWSIAGGTASALAAIPACGIGYFDGRYKASATRIIGCASP